MKLKPMSILAGAIALTVAATPFAAKAEQPQPRQASPEQAQNSPFTGVQLTDQQKAQLAQIRSDTRTKIEKILTRQQQNQYQTALQAGQGQQAAIAAMNLSEQQKTQLRTVIESARSRAEAVFTPQQRQQIEQNIQQRRQQQG